MSTDAPPPPPTDALPQTGESPRPDGHPRTDTPLRADICIIGGGSGGLSVAAGAAQVGARTVLFESGNMGGDCLNHGCVPSKALLAAARAARGPGDGLGVTASPDVHPAAVHDHVQGVIAGIAPHDSVERFEGLGVTVRQTAARFTGPAEVTGADGTVVRARRFVIATGSRPAIPPIPGLEAVPFLTNETLFAQPPAPDRLLVIGGGPIGVEMAQAHRRLGATVTVLETFRVLGRDDPELAAVVRDRLRAEGVTLHEGVTIQRLDKTATGGIVATVSLDGAVRRIDADRLLVATGRRPNLAPLDLAAAGIDHGPAGIRVDSRLRTSNRRVFAIGDVAGGWQFTHIAGYHAGIVIRNALFRLPARVSDRAVPRVTYTDPELAQVGLTEPAAREAYGDRIRTVHWRFADNDRARTERRTDGLVKIVTDRRGRILGAGVVGAMAGELLAPWALAISQKLRIGAMASVILPYPTRSEAGKRAAAAWYTPWLFSARTRRLVKLLGLFG